MLEELLSQLNQRLRGEEVVEINRDLCLGALGTGALWLLRTTGDGESMLKEEPSDLPLQTSLWFQDSG